MNCLPIVFMPSQPHSQVSLSRYYPPIACMPSRCQGLETREMGHRAAQQKSQGTREATIAAQLVDVQSSVRTLTQSAEVHGQWAAPAHPHLHLRGTSPDSDQ